MKKILAILVAVSGVMLSVYVIVRHKQTCHCTRPLRATRDVGGHKEGVCNRCLKVVRK